MADSHKNDGSVDEAVDKRGVPDNIWRRREYLAATAGLAVLAGCSGNDSTTTTTSSDGTGTSGDGSDGTTSGDSDSESRNIPKEIKIMSRLGIAKLPSDLNFNPFSQNGPGDLLGIASDMAACNVDPTSGKMVLRGLADWKWDGDAGAVTKVLRDDLVFWNGKQLTADDLYAYDELTRLTAPEGSPYESIEKTGDLSVRYVLKNPPNKMLARNVHVPGRLNWHNADQWTPWLEKFQDVSGKKEREDLVKQLTEYEVPMQKYLDNGWGTGVIKPSSWSETEIQYEQVGHGKHRFSDAIDIEKVRIYLTGYESARADQMFTNGQIDFNTSVLPPKYEGSVPSYIKNLSKWELMFSYQILINQSNHQDLRDRNVRRAMACVINTKNVVTNFGDTRANPIQNHSGLDPGSNQRYWGDDLSNLINYSPQKTDHKRADYFLEKSGYSRKNGTIYRPDGKKMKPIKFLTGAGFLFQTPSKTASLQLQDYGFPIKYNAVPRSQKMTTIQENMDQWDLSMESHYAAADNHASSYFRNWYWGYRMGPDDASVEQWLKEGKERSPFTGKPLTPEIPTSVGQEGLSGSTKEVNVLETYRKVRSTSDQAEINQGIKDLSWMWNFDVPNIDVLHLISGNAGNTRDYEWPAADKFPAYTFNPPYRFIHDGSVTYKDY